MIQKLTESKELSLMEILDFGVNFHKSTLFHFQITVDTVFGFKVIDFLENCKKIYIP